MKSPSLRRIQADIRELAIDPSDRYHAAPLENDMFEWHFTIKGADGTDFEGGIYHGRILLPAEYPFKPPNIVFLTPTGRFETNTKVCLSFSAYHPELWQPAWGIRLILEALISFLPTKGDGAIGALDWSSEERKRLAKESVKYTCPHCGNVADIMKEVEQRVQKKRAKESGKDIGASNSNKFLKQIEQLHNLQAASHPAEVKDGEKQTETGADTTSDSADEENDKKPSASKEDTLSKDETLSAVEGVKQPATDAEKDNAFTKPKSDDSNELQEEKSVQPTEATTQEVQTPTSNPETTNDTTSPDGATLVQPKPENLETPFFSDPIVHTGIAILIAIVCLLLRKINSLMQELKDIEAEIRAT